MGGYTRASDYIANRQTKIPSYVTSPSLPSNGVGFGKTHAEDYFGNPMSDMTWSGYYYYPTATTSMPLFQRQAPMSMYDWVGKILGPQWMSNARRDEIPYQDMIDQTTHYMIPTLGTASLSSPNFAINFDYQGGDKIAVDSPWDAYIRDESFIKDDWLINTVGQASDLIFTTLDSTYRRKGPIPDFFDHSNQLANYVGGVHLEAGQAYNAFTGQVDNPNLHPDDAKKINRGDAYRRVSESGLSRSNVESARTTSSVLASLTEQVVGSVRASPTDNGLQTTQRVTDIGLGQGGGRSILGTEKAAKKAKLKSILPTSSSF